GSKTRVIRVFPPGKSTRKAQEITDVTSLAEKIKADFTGAGSQKQGFSGDSNGYILPAKRADKLDRSFESTQKESDDFRFFAEKLKSLGIKNVDGITEEIKEKILADSSAAFHKKALDDMVEGLKLTKPSYSGQVWVVAEHSKGTIHPAAFELIGKATDLAKSLDTQVGVVLAGYKVESMAQELIVGGADNVYVIDDPLLEEFDPHSFQKVAADVIKKYSPQIVLFAATPQGRMLAPLISYSIGCGLTADCTSLNINDSSRKGQVAVLLQTRPALGGNIMATICTKDSTCQMATARPGVMKRLENVPSRKGKVIKHQVALTKDDISLDIISTEMGAGKVSFDSDVIVAGGKGMQSRDNYDRLVGSLCDALSQNLGVSVEKGASRAAVEQGWIDRVYQVGQTGTAVGPKLYVALGISGAIQHMIGVANTETIVAINSDPNAPVFKQCDYYIVGNVEDVVPQLVNALKG
ncbi:MAG TPA: electron transfer flavoprotein subunit alpha/FixB family protein, partial [Sedimentisphaerales bacterium]|nr:electron transfer flavoprotein subunit alpha/FixB family protein [Sedimentisphaerales bacterium]